jgi:RHS repeat-associated protein
LVSGYGVSRNYNLAGQVTSQTYPSGRPVNHAYDAAGRTSSVTGNLGDGVTRSYASSFVYNARSQMTQELFGTQTPLYHKLQYNVRGQLWDVRVSTNSDVNGSANRGGLQYFYDSSLGYGTSGPDNNGNVLFANTYVLTDDPNVWAINRQRYEYDSLNRLKWVKEYFVSNSQAESQQSLQTYDYDRWGNRTINTAQTWGTGINHTAFEVESARNRLHSPGDLAPQLPEDQRRIRYDKAGNQVKDSYTDYGTATFDGDNHIVAIPDKFGGSSTYTYNANEQRVRRKINNQETWDIYGIDGQLVAEYAANGALSAPQKEYGYRNGELLITAEAPVTNRTNVALPANGGSATASSYLGAPYNYYASYVNDGQRTAANGNIWLDNTYQSFPDWVQIDFNGTKTINEIDVVTQQDSNGNPVEPTLAMTFSSWGITAFEVQYWNGTSWATVPNGSVTGNNKVWRQFTFANITTSKIRVTVNAGLDNVYSRVVEVEAWTPTSPPKTNYALPANGGSATASSYLGPPYNFYPSYVNDGLRRAANSNIWLDNTYQSFPDWVQIDFNGTKTINEIDVVTQQDSTPPLEPTLAMTFASWGITAYEVQYWNGTSWATVPNGSVTGNNKVWRQFTFANITTSKIRVTVNAGLDNVYSRVVEVEAWGDATGGSATTIHWLVPDHLGTPRIILDQTGASANVKRHDYLPFGEELYAGTGGRTAAMGYAAGDGVRQQFTGKERDVETGLDYFGARYYSSIQGRFTSVDPGSFVPADPQSWNRYPYTQNNPLKFTDPTGEELYFTGDYAGGIIADLEKYSGLKLKRDPTTGKVTIDPSQKRRTKGTSYYLAEALGKAIGNDKVKVNVRTVSESKDNEAIYIDSFVRQKFDVDDYEVMKRDAPDFAAGALTHLITEYYEAQLLPAPLSLDAIYRTAHKAALETESDTIGDLNGNWWQEPRADTVTSGALEHPPMTLRYKYSTVEYDVFVKSGVNGRATQVDKVTKIDKTPKPKKK